MEGKVAVYEIEIVNWGKYNGKRADKQNKWFAVDVNMIYDPIIQQLSAAEFKVWVWLLSERARIGQSSITLDTDFVQRSIKVRAEFIHSSIRLLTEFGRLLTKEVKRPKGLMRGSGQKKRPHNSTGHNSTGHNRTPIASHDASEGETTAEYIEPETPKEKSSDEHLADAWLSYARSEMPWDRSPAGWTTENFARDIAKVKTATGLTDAGMAALLEFVRADEFWRDKALSPGSLLKRSERNGQRKIDNILLRMKPKESKTDRALREYAQDTTPVTDELPF